MGNLNSLLNFNKTENNKSFSTSKTKKKIKKDIFFAMFNSEIKNTKNKKTNSLKNETIGFLQKIESKNKQSKNDKLDNKNSELKNQEFQHSFLNLDLEKSFKQTFQKNNNENISNVNENINKEKKERKNFIISLNSNKNPKIAKNKEFISVHKIKLETNPKSEEIVKEQKLTREFLSISENKKTKNIFQLKKESNENLPNMTLNVDEPQKFETKKIKTTVLNLTQSQQPNLNIELKNNNPSKTFVNKEYKTELKTVDTEINEKSIQNTNIYEPKENLQTSLKFAKNKQTKSETNVFPQINSSYLGLNFKEKELKDKKTQNLNFIISDQNKDEVKPTKETKTYIKNHFIISKNSSSSNSTEKNLESKKINFQSFDKEIKDKSNEKHNNPEIKQTFLRTFKEMKITKTTKGINPEQFNQYTIKNNDKNTTDKPKYNRFENSESFNDLNLKFPKKQSSEEKQKITLKPLKDNQIKYKIKFIKKLISEKIEILQQKEKNSANKKEELQYKGLTENSFDFIELNLNENLLKDEKTKKTLNLETNKLVSETPNANSLKNENQNSNTDQNSENNSAESFESFQEKLEEGNKTKSNFTLNLKLNDLNIKANLRNQVLNLVINSNSFMFTNSALTNEIRTILLENGFKNFNLTIKEKGKKIFEENNQESNLPKHNYKSLGRREINVRA